MDKRAAPHVDSRAQPVPDAGVALFEFEPSPRLPFGVSRFEVGVGAETSIDQHAVEEIWLIAAGNGELFYGGTWYPIAFGQVVRFRGGIPHRMRNLGDQPMKIFSIWWSEDEPGS